MPSLEVFQDEAGGWRYRVKAENGEIVASSESYTTKESAERGARDLFRAVTTMKNAEGNGQP